MVRKILSLMVVIVVVSLSVNITVSADIQITDINSGWHWPTSSSIRTITSEFGRVRTNTIHQAIDIDGKTGDPVYATRDGDVVESFSSCKGSHEYGECSCSGGQYYGNYVVIYHGTWNGNKIYSMYMHLDSVSIKSGTVKARQQIGTMGNTGPSQGDHLHFQISKGSKNPSHSNITLARNNFINTNPSKAMFLNGTFSHNRIGNDSYPYSEYGNITYIMDGGNVVPPDTEAPTISGLNVKDVSGDSFTVECNLNDNVGVTRVWLNVWGPNGTFKGYGLSASNGAFSVKIKTSDYGGAGYYSVHMSAFDAAGNESAQVKKSDICAYTDTEKPTISGLNVTNVSSSSFTVKCNLSDNVGVNRVWLNIYGPGGSNGYSVSASNGNFSHTINTSDYGGAGIYSVHLYAFDSSGNAAVSNLSDINAVNDIESPVISNLYTSNVSSSSFTINCNLSDNTGVTRVWLNIYGPNGSNGYGVSASNGSFIHTINTADYGGRGKYTVHIYAFDATGNGVQASLNDINAVTDSQAPVVALIRPTNVTSNSFTINGTMYDNVGVTRVWLNIYGPNGSNGYSVDTSSNSFSHTINTSDYGGSGYYSIHVYAWDSEGNSASGTLSNFYVGDDYSAPTITNLDVSGISDSSFTINCTANEKVVRAWVYIMGPNKTEGYAVHLYDDKFMHTIDTSKYGGAGSYEVHIYLWDSAGNESSGYSTGRFIANKRYTVNFNANQGITPLSSMIVTNSANYGVLPIPNRVGYDFNGWYTATSGGTQIIDSSIVWLSSAQTLYAHWSPKNYIAYLNVNGGNIDKDTISITYDSTYSELPIPTRKGYYFNGWYTTASGGEKITNNTKVTVTSNQTLYARWEKLIPDTESVVTKNSSNYYINVIPVNIEDSCEIVIAGYKGSKFVSVTSIPYASKDIYTTLSGDIDEIKVMVWNSLSGLKPLCEAEVIPSSEFIIE